MTYAICTAPRRNSLHWQQDNITWPEIVAWAGAPATVKESGNYLLGTLRPSTVRHDDRSCTNLHRRKDFVVSRSAITLDVDFPQEDFVPRVEMLFAYAGLLHTTYSSTAEAPRYRMIVPTDREMTPDEYIAAAKTLMSQLGESQFDPGTSQPERYMFRPAAEDLTAYHFRELHGPILSVDDLLADFEEDLSTRPVPRPHRNKRNPYELDGVIGAFNRAYRDEWDLLIRTYDLPYEKVGHERYQLAGSRAAAGMGTIPETEGLVYSHHSNDPAGERACSAFDLVRLHLFAEDDEDAPPGTPVNRLPSHEAMAALATQDPRCIGELVGTDFEEEMAADDWRLGLHLTPRTGQLKDEIHNWDLIVQHDPLFANLCYNERSMAVEYTAAPPWRPLVPPQVGETDLNNIVFAIERTYGLRPKRFLVDALVDAKAHERVVNPVKDYLLSLEWDGIPRVEECLPGVKADDYARLVARKSMVAAVARAIDPGCKWDHTLVLYGPEGIGKTWWIERVARGYSTTLGGIRSKDTLLSMQQSWIMISDEASELKSIPKNGHNAMKEFLTRREDLFRAPYERGVKPHPRGCVIWATTNDAEFLSRQEGNRRFLIVECQDKVDFDAITDYYVDQLWAEAVALYRGGELLFFNEAEAIDAAAERENFMEEDAIFGVIVDFLDTPVPAEWDFMKPDERELWISDYRRGFQPAGPGRIDHVCSTQIWVEALGRRRGDHKKEDLLMITDALKRVPGWRKVDGRPRMCGYGPQLTFSRQTDNDQRGPAEDG